MFSPSIWYNGQNGPEWIHQFERYFDFLGVAVTEPWRVTLASIYMDVPVLSWFNKLQESVNLTWPVLIQAIERDFGVIDTGEHGLDVIAVTEIAASETKDSLSEEAQRPVISESEGMVEEYMKANGKEAFMPGILPNLGQDDTETVWRSLVEDDDLLPIPETEMSTEILFLAVAVYRLAGALALGLLLSKGTTSSRVATEVDDASGGLEEVDCVICPENEFNINFPAKALSEIEVEIHVAAAMQLAEMLAEEAADENMFLMKIHTIPAVREPDYRQKRMQLILLLLCSTCLVNLVAGFASNGSLSDRMAAISYLESDMAMASTSAATSPSSPTPLMVALTLIRGAASSGAVCLDGTLPGYHLHRGHGSGANSWLIQLEGGGWCNTIRNCVYRKTTRRGSSKYMERLIPFTGILSNKAEENPDFFNWNRVKLRYCDGASFSGDSQDEASQLNFRGQKIWLAAMEDLMSNGMKDAEQALLSGCSAGGLASILHCDEFRSLLPRSTKVKCLSDAGFFLDAIDVSGGRTLRQMYEGVVRLQEVQKNLPSSCLNHLDPTSCFFPQNLVANVKTPLFLLNAAYDAWQLQASLAAPSADPHGTWSDCKSNHARCNSSQIHFLQDFRNQMLRAVEVFSRSSQNGLFINSCFAHCQSERQDTWFADDSPVIRNQPIAIAVGNWFFDREAVKAIDCAYPCDNTCHNLVFK